MSICSSLRCIAFRMPDSFVALIMFWFLKLLYCVRLSCVLFTCLVVLHVSFTWYVLPFPLPMYCVALYLYLTLCYYCVNSGVVFVCLMRASLLFLMFVALLPIVLTYIVSFVVLIYIYIYTCVLHIHVHIYIYICIFDLLLNS